jgi:hypothetical protein
MTRAREKILAGKTIAIFIQAIGIAGMGLEVFLGVCLGWEGAAVQVP